MRLGHEKGVRTCVRSVSAEGKAAGEVMDSGGRKCN